MISSVTLLQWGWKCNIGIESEKNAKVIEHNPTQI